MLDAERKETTEGSERRAEADRRQETNVNVLRLTSSTSNHRDCLKR